MSKLKPQIPPKRFLHKPCKSQIDSTSSKLGREESLNSLDSPLVSCERRSQKLFKTMDNREPLLGDPSEVFDLKKTRTRANLVQVRFDKSHLNLIEKAGTAPEILKDQDNIIKLQNSLIESLREEIFILNNNKDSKDKLSKGIIDEGFEDALEEYENQIESLKKTVKRKEETIKELKIEMEAAVKKKEMKIEKLEKTIEKLEKERDDEDLVDLREQLRTANTQLRVLAEENKILAQNYEEVRKGFFNVDKQLHPIQSLISKLTNSQMENNNIPGYIENLFNQNKHLSEKLRFFSEKLPALENENNCLKQRLGRYQKKVEGLENKLEESEDSQILIQTLRKKTEKIEQLKKKIGTSKKSDNRKVKFETPKSNPEYSVLEDHMSVIEEELNLLKTENRILISKENDLSHKLKSSEKARYYYQEQTISLKEKVNNLENQLKMIEFSIQELKAQNDSPIHLKIPNCT